MPTRTTATPCGTRSSKPAAERAYLDSPDIHTVVITAEIMALSTRTSG